MRCPPDRYTGSVVNEPSMQVVMYVRFGSVCVSHNR